MEALRKQCSESLLPDYAKTDTWEHLNLNPGIFLNHAIEFTLAWAELSSSS
jgi:hypothetical protein